MILYDMTNQNRMMKSRLFIGAILCMSVAGSVFAQNLLLNGYFENVISGVSHEHGQLDSFYAKHWFTATGSTVDIYSSIENCSSNSVWNLEPKLHYCVDAQRGKYCLGIGLINNRGSVEHITGRLKKALRSDHTYRVSYYFKANGGATFYSEGLGFKLSQDSIIFRSDIGDFMGLSPSYNDLFNTTAIYAEYESSTVPLDTNWTRVEYIYKAAGGERFITLGRFAYPNDKKKRKLFDQGMSRINI